MVAVQGVANWLVDGSNIEVVQVVVIRIMGLVRKRILIVSLPVTERLLQVTCQVVHVFPVDYLIWVKLIGLLMQLRAGAFRKDVLHCLNLLIRVVINSLNPPVLKETINQLVN